MRARYNPWRDLRDNWPHIAVWIVPMSGRLLGELDYPNIYLRAGTTAAQRRSTLTHELVHLERGIYDCGPLTSREERLVHAEAARRLVTTDQLARVVRAGVRDAGALAAALEVDRETLRVRLGLLSDADRRRLATPADELWDVA